MVLHCTSIVINDHTLSHQTFTGSPIERLWDLLLLRRDRTCVVQVDTLEECASLLVNCVLFDDDNQLKFSKNIEI